MWSSWLTGLAVETVPLCPQQIPDDVTGNWSRAAAGKCRRQSDWATVTVLDLTYSLGICLEGLRKPIKTLVKLTLVPTKVPTFREKLFSLKMVAADYSEIRRYILEDGDTESLQWDPHVRCNICLNYIYNLLEIILKLDIDNGRQRFAVS